jgi:hypothetical protein
MSVRYSKTRHLTADTSHLTTTTTVILENDRLMSRFSKILAKPRTNHPNGWVLIKAIFLIISDNRLVDVAKIGVMLAPRPGATGTLMRGWSGFLSVFFVLPKIEVGNW